MCGSLRRDAADRVGCTGVGPELAGWLARAPDRSCDVLLFRGQGDPSPLAITPRRSGCRLRWIGFEPADVSGVYLARPLLRTLIDLWLDRLPFIDRWATEPVARKCDRPTGAAYPALLDADWRSVVDRGPRHEPRLGTPRREPSNLRDQGLLVNGSRPSAVNVARFMVIRAGAMRRLSRRSVSLHSTSPLPSHDESRVVELACGGSVGNSSRSWWLVSTRTGAGSSTGLG
jgi:hypothetical protein